MQPANCCTPIRTFVARHEHAFAVTFTAVGMIGLGLLIAGIVMHYQNCIMKEAIDFQAEYLPFPKPYIDSLYSDLDKTQAIASILIPTGCGLICLTGFGFAGYIFNNSMGKNKAKWIALGCLAVLGIGIGMTVGHGLWTSQNLPRILDRTILLHVVREQQNLNIAAVNFLVLGALSTGLTSVYIATRRNENE